MTKLYSRSVEDYLEAIYNIVLEKGYARTKDISQELKITPSSVTGMMRKLDSDGLINYEKYGAVTLTDKGREIAETIKEKHDILRAFLNILMISDKTADADACRLEHDLSPESIKQLTRFVEFVEEAPINPRWLEHFREYCATGEYSCNQIKKKINRL